MAEENTITTVFRADISQFSASTQQLNQYVRNVNSQFEAATAGMGKWSDNTDGLQAKIQQLNGTLEADKKKLAELSAQYQKMADEGKGNTFQAKQLQIAINKQIATIKKTEKQTDDYTEALKELENAGVKTKQELKDLTDAQEKQGKSAGSVAGKLAKGLGAGIAAVGGAAVGAVGSFMALAEGTREYRQGLNQLETAFGRVGFSAEETYEAFNYFGSVLGDTRKAQETMLVLGQLVNSEKELESWTDTLTGVYATYGEAIPLESMSEAVVLASKQAVAEGGLADALEWGGVNLEQFNDKLASLNSEEERSAYIQETLNGLYGEAAQKYNELNKDVLDASTAQTNLEHATAQLGAVAEPIMTMLKNSAAGLLQTMQPFVQLMGEGLQAVFSGSAEGAKQFAQGLSGLIDHLLKKITELLPSVINVVMELFPTLIKTLADALPSIINALHKGVAQILNALSEMLPDIIPIIIDAVLMVVETVLDNLDMLIDAGIKMIIALADGLIKALPRLIDKIPVIIDKAVRAIINNLPKLIAAGVELTLKLAEGLIKAVPQLVGKIPEIIASIVKGFADGLPQMLEVGKNLIKGVWEGIKATADWLWNKVKDFFGGLLDKIKKFLGINSPSKLFENEIGANLALGIGEGFNDEMSHVEKSMQKSISRLAPSLQIDSPDLPPINNGGNWVDRLAELISSKQGETVNNYKFDYKFEKIQTSKLALHKAELATRRIVGGTI